MAKAKDPTEAMRNMASSFPEVDAGTSCTQSSFKVGGKAFLFVGMQGGRYKAMFKLEDSLRKAEELAAEQPDNYQVGSTAWVTVRFTAEDPVPRQIWEKWLKESYRLSVPVSRTPAKKTTRKKSHGPSAKKKSAKKKIPKKKS